MILEYARWFWLPAVIALFVAIAFLLHAFGAGSRHEDAVAVGNGRVAASWMWIAIALFVVACIADAVLPGGAR